MCMRVCCSISTPVTVCATGADSTMRVYVHNDPMYSYDIIQRGSRHCNSHLLMYEWSINASWTRNTNMSARSVCIICACVYVQIISCTVAFFSAIYTYTRADPTSSGRYALP